MRTAGSHHGLFGALLLALSALAATTANGCVSVEGGDGGNGGDGGSGSGSGSGKTSAQGSGSGTPSTGTGGDHYVCCLNDAHFVCPSKAAFDKCLGFDIDACMQACAPSDFECHNACFDQAINATHDPSDCNADSTVDCGGTGTGPTTGAGPTTGPGPTTGAGGSPNCSGILSGCDYDSDCCSNNCTNNTCYGNAFGNPCEYDSDCSSNNCFDGSCQ